MKMVVVDDAPNILKGIAFLLEAAGKDYQVVGKAFNGLQGIEVVSEVRPDIVFTDISMPFCDGIEMIRRLKEQGEKAEFILLSGYAEFEYAKKAMELGVRYYLTKPINEDEMYGTIEKIRKERAADLPSAQPDIVQEIREYISRHYADDISLNAIAEKYYMNPNYLSQVIKKKTGKTYQQYITGLRIGHAERLLRETGMKIYEVAETVGYGDVRHFCTLFERITGRKPSDYIAERKGAKA